MLFSVYDISSKQLFDWWKELSPSFLSLSFVFFVFCLSFLYYIVPKRFQWGLLLVGSIAFYSLAGWEALVALILTSFFIWSAGLTIDFANDSNIRRKRWVLLSSIACLVIALVFVKVCFYEQVGGNYVIPLGISYYTFSGIAYLADVYWKKEKAETNPLKFSLFMFYFPKILQGPISRHKTIGTQLSSFHVFNYTNYCYGMQLAIWGFFKKLVIADRIAIFTSEVFRNFKQYGGCILLLSILFSGMQLYCDFSGCMDIASGISQMFGIDLEPNFNHPFCSKSASEFWQRWHMTLGGWFRDYLFLPISRTPLVKSISKKGGNIFGSSARKKIIIILSSLIVWVATGLWHGTGVPYLVWGLYWYTIITISLLSTDFIKKLKEKLHIDDKSTSYQLFQMVRTYLVFCFGRLITIPNNLGTSVQIIKRILYHGAPWELFDGSIIKAGLDASDFYIVIVSIGIVLFVEHLQRQCVIRNRIAKWNLICRALFYSLAVLVILVLGIYGSGYGNTTFLYMNY